MSEALRRIAVYTTIYPGVEAYLGDWFRSLKAQTDRDFQLWIGLDGVDAVAVESIAGANLNAVWVPSVAGDSPASIRQRALEQIIMDFEAVVLVDSDDILHPTRVAAAREALQHHELTACALRLVDASRQDLTMTLTLPPQTTPNDILPRTNIFGFSNSAFRSSLLRRCLPIPRSAVLVDWLLATRAWLIGGAIHFDKTVHMDYRQHGENTAPISFPLKANRVIKNTEKVWKHFELLLSMPPADRLAHRWAQVVQTAEDVRLFAGKVVGSAENLECYLAGLNALEPQSIWWWDVAHPALQRMWRGQTISTNETYQT